MKNEKEKSTTVNRREFLSASAILGGAMAIGSSGVLSSCSGKEKGPVYTPLCNLDECYIPALNDKAIDGAPLKVGLVGCGGRGSGAVINLLDAADNIQVVALGDLFDDRLQKCRDNLKAKKKMEVPADKCFLGFDAYKKVIDSGVDMVIIATPPVFRPEHFKYAVEKNKHSFLEKPVAVDPTGYKTIVAASKQAAAKGLCVYTGTQRHHQRNYVEAYKKVQSGMIGEITGGEVYWNQGMLWFKTPEKGWSDMEYMIRDWVNWKWLSGDHIVEQHVHNIDVFNWFLGKKPQKAVGVGSRQRRITGDQYDNFSVDFDYGNGIHLHSMCRQIDGCANQVAEIIRGTKGYAVLSAQPKAEIYDNGGNLLWSWDAEAEKAQYKQTSPYVLEHVEWVNRIRENKPMCFAQQIAESTLAGVMGREAAYTGQEVTWDKISASNMNMMPEKLELGRMDTRAVIPVPGISREEKLKADQAKKEQQKKAQQAKAKK